MARDPQETVSTKNSKGEKIEVTIPKLPRFIARVTKEFLVQARAFEIENSISETALVAVAVKEYMDARGYEPALKSIKLTDVSGTRGPAKKYATEDEAKKARSTAAKKNRTAQTLLMEQVAKMDPALLAQIKLLAEAKVAEDEAKATAKPAK